MAALTRASGGIPALCLWPVSLIPAHWPSLYTGSQYRWASFRRAMLQGPWVSQRLSSGHLKPECWSFTGSPVGSSPLQDLENCLREIPVPRTRPACSWSLAGDRGPRSAEPKNWTADKEGKHSRLGAWEQDRCWSALALPPCSWQAACTHEMRRCPGNSLGRGWCCWPVCGWGQAGRPAHIARAGPCQQGAWLWWPHALVSSQPLSCGPPGSL